MPLHDFTSTTYTSCGLGNRPELEHPIEIKDQHQLSVEPMHTGADMRELAIEIDWSIFSACSSRFQHLSDLIDQQSVGFAIELYPERQLPVAGFFALHIEPFPHVNDRQNASAYIKKTRNLRGRQRHLRETIGNEYILHARNRNAEKLAANDGGNVFGHAVRMSHLVTSWRGWRFLA
jgi:hypothetical protein